MADLWMKIKKYLSKEGDKCIILEEGKPAYLVSRLAEDSDSENSQSAEGEIEQVNRQIDQWKAAQAEEVIEPEEKETVTPLQDEDLPF